MKIKEMISFLSECDKNADVLLLRSFNMISPTKIEQIDGAAKSDRGIVLVNDKNRKVVVLS